MLRRLLRPSPPPSFDDERAELHAHIAALNEHVRQQDAQHHDVAAWIANYSLMQATPRDPIAHELSVFSQNGEDGILLSLMDAIGLRTGRSLELGSGDSTECCTAILALRDGWSCTFVDGDETAAAAAPNGRVMHRWITTESAREIVHSIGNSVDVLAIDLDGNDYWIWEAVSYDIRPAVVVIEYNASFGPAMSASLPYRADFVWPGTGLEPQPENRLHAVYHGASLLALDRLGQRNGYRLVGCDSAGVNAFFVRADFTAHVLTRTVAEAWRACARRAPLGPLETQLEALLQQPVVIFD